MIEGPKCFNFKEEDTIVVRAFKEKKLYIWFRELLPEHSIINELPKH